MEKQYVCCNVESCKHNCNGKECSLDEIQVTNSGEIQTAHFCGSYSEWSDDDVEIQIYLTEKHNLY